MRRQWGWWTLGAIGIWLLVLSVLTERRLPAWHDDVTLWQAALEVDPASPTAHNDFAVSLLHQGRLREAEGHFEIEERLRPDRLVAHMMLAMSYRQRGAIAQAEAEEAIVGALAAQRFKPGATLQSLQER